jgi:hypothetical protein
MKESAYCVGTKPRLATPEEFYPSLDSAFITNEFKGHMTTFSKNEWTVNVAHMTKTKNAYQILELKREGKEPHGRFIRSWEDNTKGDLKEMG